MKVIYLTSWKFYFDTTILLESVLFFDHSILNIADVQEIVIEYLKRVLQKKQLDLE